MNPVPGKSQISLTNSDFHLGFTIIELLITITIILLFTGLGFTGYSYLNKRQQIIGAGQSLKNLIRDAQSRAFNYEIDCNVCDCSTSSEKILYGWFVDFGNNTIYGKCKGTLGGEETINIVSFNLDSEIKITPYITPNVTPAAIVFNYSPPSADQQATICVTSTNLSGNYYVIRVYKSGLIKDEGGLQITCTP